MTIVKAIVQLLMTVLAAVVPALAAGPMTVETWINVVILGAGVIMVYNAANIPGWEYAKLIASAVSAVAVLLVSAWQGGLSGAEIIQLVLAAAGAVGVGALPNGNRPAHAA